MRKKFGNHWVEFTDPLDLIYRPSNVEIGSCWYQERVNNKWTYDFTDQLMVDLKTIIALAIMTYIGESNVYELHLGDEKHFNDFADES